MKNLFLSAFVFISWISIAQHDTSDQVKPGGNSEVMFTTLTEQSPEFPGGEKEMETFISQNLVYPKIAKDNRVQGTVRIRFTISVRGELENITLLINKEKLGFGLEEAAVDVIRKMPSWRPGKQNGVVVPITYTIPIQFSLKDPEVLSKEKIYPKEIITEKEEKMPHNVFLISTVKPQYPGGKTAMINFISNTLIYPAQAIENKKEGKVTLKFIVDSIGKICCVGTMGEAIGYGLEEEAIRIVKAMPLWIPAATDDKPVAVYYRMPITFKYYEE